MTFITFIDSLNMLMLEEPPFKKRVYHNNIYDASWYAFKGFKIPVQIKMDLEKFPIGCFNSMHGIFFEKNTQQESPNIMGAFLGFHW